MRGPHWEADLSATGTTSIALITGTEGVDSRGPRGVRPLSSIESSVELLGVAGKSLY